MVLDSIDGEGLGRKPQDFEQVAREQALERHIADGADDRRAPAAAIMEIGRRKARLPVVHVQDVRLDARNQSASHHGCDLPEGGEALGVVGPVAPVHTRIRQTRAAIEMGRVDHEKIERPCGAARSRAGPPKRFSNVKAGSAPSKARRTAG